MSFTGDEIALSAKNGESPTKYLLVVLLKVLRHGFHIGDACEDACSSVIGNSYCNLTTNTCQCLDSHPIVIEGVACVEGER